MRLAALLLALAAPAAAGEAVNCEEAWIASLANLVEPLEDTTRAYADGDVRVLVLASPEPACCGVTAAVLLPDPLDGARVCRAFVENGGSGWGGLSFGPGEARYDPALGLVVPMTASTWDGEAYARAPVEIVVDQAAGRVFLR